MPLPPSTSLPLQSALLGLAGALLVGLVAGLIPAGGTSMAFAMGAYESEGTAHIGGDKSGAGNDIAIVHQDLATATWVAIPEDFPPVSNISISDDGATLAVISNPFHTAIEASENATTIALIDVASNQELTRTDPFTAPHGAFFTWVEDGAAAVYASDSAVYRLPAEASATPATLYETETTLRYIDAYMRPNILLVQEQVTAGGPESRGVMLRTDNGEVTRFEGDAWSLGTTAFIPFEFPLTPLVLELKGQGDSTWSIVHPVTGETLMSDEGTITATPVPGEDGVMWLQQVRIVAEDAPVSAVMPGDGRIAIFDLSSAEPVITDVMVPENIVADGYRIQSVSLAPDGSALTVETKLDDVTRYWTLDLNDRNAAWTQLPDGVTVGYLHTGQ